MLRCCQIDIQPVQIQSSKACFRSSQDRDRENDRDKGRDRVMEDHKPTLTDRATATPHARIFSTDTDLLSRIDLENNPSVGNVGDTNSVIVSDSVVLARLAALWQRLIATYDAITACTLSYSAHCQV